jgi:hypothetical protein
MLSVEGHDFTFCFCGALLVALSANWNNLAFWLGKKSKTK